MLASKRCQFRAERAPCAADRRPRRRPARVPWPQCPAGAAPAADRRQNPVRPASIDVPMSAVSADKGKSRSCPADADCPAWDPCQRVLIDWAGMLTGVLPPHAATGRRHARPTLQTLMATGVAPSCTGGAAGEGLTARPRPTANPLAAPSVGPRGCGGRCFPGEAADDAPWSRPCPRTPQRRELSRSPKHCEHVRCSDDSNSCDCCMARRRSPRFVSCRGC